MLNWLHFDFIIVVLMSCYKWSRVPARRCSWCKLLIGLKRLFRSGFNIFFLAVWILLSYLIISVRRILNGRYTIPWSEAETECQARGMTLASRADMLESRELGLDICACGWLSDGTAGLVIRNYDPGCGYGNENTVYSCSLAYVDAYCIWI